jgi:hypothetical protein
MFSTGVACRKISDDAAIGTNYCFAHHLTINGDNKNLMVAAIRYFDEFVKINHSWFFKKRDLKVAWVETKPQIAKTRIYQPTVRN